MERYDIIAWRSRYLGILNKNEADSENYKPVTFLDETYVNPSYWIKKCWQSTEEPGVYYLDKALPEIMHKHQYESYYKNLLTWKLYNKNGNYTTR